MNFDFKWSDVLKEDKKDIVKTNFIENHKSKLKIVFFQKKRWMHYNYSIEPMKWKIKKIWFEVISNTKFYIKFCPMNFPTTKIFSNLLRDWTTSNTIK